MSAMEHWKNLSMGELDGEIWRSVLGYEGVYEVSSMGRVKTLPKTGRRNALVLKQKHETTGYLRIALWSDGKVEIPSVHTLVLQVFSGVVIPVDQRRKIFVNHKDGVKTNNVFSNLEYVTPKENYAHAVRIGISNQKGVNNPSAKFTVEQVKQIRSSKGTCAEIGKIFGVWASTVSLIKRRVSYPEII